jgi:hypothetical protein
MNPRKHHMRPASRNAGLVLVEVLAVAAIMILCLGLFLSIFTSASRLSALNMRTFERLRAAEDLTREFNGAVARAIAVVPGVASYRSGEDTLVLALPPRENRPRYIVIGRDAESKRCFRMEMEGAEDGFEALHATSFPLPLAVLRFEYDKARPESARLVTLHAEVVADTKNPARRWVVETPAALRGIGALESAVAEGGAGHAN